MLLPAVSIASFPMQDRHDRVIPMNYRKIGPSRAIRTKHHERQGIDETCSTGESPMRKFASPGFVTGAIGGTERPVRADDQQAQTTSRHTLPLHLNDGAMNNFAIAVTQYRADLREVTNAQQFFSESVISLP
jgi:hypothetical protein